MILDEIVIIENTTESKDKFGHAYGSNTLELTIEQFEALKNGKCLAFCDSEYTTFIVLKEGE